MEPETYQEPELGPNSIYYLTPIHPFQQRSYMRMLWVPRLSTSTHTLYPIVLERFSCPFPYSCMNKSLWARTEEITTHVAKIQPLRTSAERQRGPRWTNQDHVSCHEGLVRSLPVFKEQGMISLWTFFRLVGGEVFGSQHPIFINFI